MHIRHPDLDMWILHEIARNHVYQPPPVAHAYLSSLDRTRIVDVGGHIGLAGSFFLSLWENASILSIEPDVEQATIIRDVIERNRLGAQWSTLEACAWVSEGTLPFISNYHGSRADPSIDAPTVPAMDVLPLLREAHLVKMDVQGGEWDILSDSRFPESAPPVLVLEYHPWGCRGGNADQEARRLLRRAKYQLGQTEHIREREGTIWAWRADLL